MAFNNEGIATVVSSRDQQVGVVYSDKFTENELRQLLEFSKSPVGRRSAELSASVAEETAQLYATAVRSDFSKLWAELWQVEWEDLSKRLARYQKEKTTDTGPRSPAS